MTVRVVIPRSLLPIDPICWTSRQQSGLVDGDVARMLGVGIVLFSHHRYHPDEGTSSWHNQAVSYVAIDMFALESIHKWPLS